MIIQLPTEKIGLRKFLYGRLVPGIEDEVCGCDLGQQTVMHVLLGLPRAKDRIKLTACITKRKHAFIHTESSLQEPQKRKCQ